MMPDMNGMPGSPQQMEQVMNMLENPMMRQMMDNMVQQNPDMIRSMMEAQNPMFRQMFAQNPEMANNMIREMMNPDNLRTMMQLQQSFGGTGASPTTPAVGGTGAPPLDFSTLLGHQANRAAPAPGGMAPLDFGSMMQQFQNMQTGFGGGASATPPSNMHPADTYRSQLAELRNMGFDDEQANLAALQASFGNLNRAVDQLLSSPMPPAGAPSAPPAAAATDSSANSSSGNAAADDNTDHASEDKEE
uniref:UBA domain-containing protein n=1 Tax=Craspedostauros australis TaxID=1486917 RepID=A0A7R9WPE1_9STRA